MHNVVSFHMAKGRTGRSGYKLKLVSDSKTSAGRNGWVLDVQSKEAGDSRTAGGFNVFVSSDDSIAAEWSFEVLRSLSDLPPSQADHSQGHADHSPGQFDQGATTASNTPTPQAPLKIMFVLCAVVAFHLYIFG